MSWYREPLLHFVAIGGILFIVYSRSVDSGDQSSILIDETRVDEIARQFNIQWEREPSSDELEMAIDSYVRDEVLFREAIALGLDRDDDNIRRHLVAKMKALSPELVSVAAPSDEELDQYVKDHPEDFRSPDRIELEQLFFDPAVRGPEVADEARAALADLKTAVETDMTKIGDPSDALQTRYTDLSDRDAEAVFGRAFREQVFALEVGQWLGPIESNHGVHLVFVHRLTPGTPQLPERARRNARRMLVADQAREAENALFRRVSQNYEIEIKTVLEHEQNRVGNDGR